MINSTLILNFCTLAVMILNSLVKFRTSIIFFLFVQFAGEVFAQTISTHPEKRLPKTKENIREAEILLKYSENSNNDSIALQYAYKAAALAEKNKLKKEQSIALRYIGNYYVENSDSVKAVYYYKLSMDICKQIKDKENQIKVLRNLGILYVKFLDYPKSTRYYQQAVNLAKDINDEKLLADIYGNYGRVFYQTLNFPKAFEYYQKSLDICEKNNYKEEKTEILQKIGELYYHLEKYDKTLDCADQIIILGNETGNMKRVAFAYAWRGNILMLKGKYKESLKQYDKSIKIWKEINDEEGLASDYANVACEYQLLSDYTTALKYHQECYKLFKKNHDRYSEMLYMKDMGGLVQNAPDDVLKKIGIHSENRFPASLDYEAKAFRIAEELGDTPQKTYILEFMISAYEKIGDYQAAYSSYQKLTKLKNDMTGNQVRSEIAKKESQYFFEKKEEAEKALNEKNKARLKFRYSIALSAFFIISVTGFSLFYYTRMRKRKEKQLYEANRKIMKLEKEKIESELNRAKLEMKQFITSLNEKNNLINKISEELQQLNYTLDEEKTVMKATLNEIKNSVILTDNDWKIFLMRFEKIYPDFSVKIKSKYPKITTAELRYLMLVKIGLSNKGMADILGVSLNTIHVTWKRLREKLGFSKAESPQDILNQIKIPI